MFSHERLENFGDVLLLLSGVLGFLSNWASIGVNFIQIVWRLALYEVFSSVRRHPTHVYTARFFCRFSLPLILISSF